MKLNHQKFVGFVAVITIALFVGLIVICVLFVKYNSEMPYTEKLSGFGTLIISVFAAVFSGLNVLAFYFLTMAVEKQNTKREEKAFQIQAMKYKLANQKEVFDKVVSILQQFTISDRVHQIRECTDPKFIDDLYKNVKDEYEALQILANCNTLFPSLSSDSIQKVTQIYKEGISKHAVAVTKFYRDLADGYDDEDLQKLKTSIASFWELQSYILIQHLQLLIAQMRYDKLVTLAKSLDQSADFQPEWLEIANAIKNIESVSSVLEMHLANIDTPPLTHRPPVTSIYNWDFSATIEDDNKQNVTQKMKQQPESI